MNERLTSLTTPYEVRLLGAGDKHILTSNVWSQFVRRENILETSKGVSPAKNSNQQKKKNAKLGRR